MSDLAHNDRIRDLVLELFAVGAVKFGTYVCGFGCKFRKAAIVIIFKNYNNVFIRINHMLTSICFVLFCSFMFIAHA